METYSCSTLGASFEVPSIVFEKRKFRCYCRAQAVAVTGRADEHQVDAGGGSCVSSRASPTPRSGLPGPSADRATGLARIAEALAAHCRNAATYAQ